MNMLKEFHDLLEDTDDRCKECKKDWTKCSRCPVRMEKVGRWIEDGEGFLYPYKCSNCGSFYEKLYNYCPSCGEKKDLSEWEV